MTAFELHFASGAGFFTGCALIIGGLAMMASARRKLTVAAADVLTLAGVIGVALSSTPLATWFVVASLLALVTCTITLHRRTAAGRARWVIAAVPVLPIVLAVAWEWRQQALPDIPPAAAPRLYVIGDSISAGVGRENGRPWPKILQGAHAAEGVEVVDLSVGGETLGTALSRLRDKDLGDGMILLEIGGNDMLGGAPADRFARDLDHLLRRVTGPGRTVVMLELPLPPLQAGIARAQRRLARQYHVTLIPKRYFAALFAGDGMTLDGLHLTPGGHERMARVMWSLLGGSLRAHSPATTAPTSPRARL